MRLACVEPTSTCTPTLPTAPHLKRRATLGAKRAERSEAIFPSGLTESEGQRANQSRSMLHFLHKLSFDLTMNRKRLALVLLLDDDYPKKKERKLWVHQVNRMRQEHGEFHHLTRNLIDDESRFFRYFRMSRDSFFRLHELIEDKIKRRTTNFRKPIATPERLAVTVR